MFAIKVANGIEHKLLQHAKRYETQHSEGNVKLIKHNMLVDINIYEIQLGHCISNAICVSQILNLSLKGQINGNISISNNAYFTA